MSNYQFPTWLAISLALPALSGWLLIRVLEGKKPLMLPLERIAMGFTLGLTGTMFLSFTAHIALKVPFSLWGFLLVQIATAVVLVLIATKKRLFPPYQNFETSNPTSPSLRGAGEKRANELTNLRPFSKILLVILAMWTIIKIAALTMSLVATPPTFDDTIDNWNMRGKLFFVNQSLTLAFPEDPPGTINSISAYPPTVPLAKAFLASIAGDWNEGLINSIHLVWYLVALILVFCFLKRHVGLLLGVIGTYALASLPLTLIHGTNAYADVFESLHLFIAVIPIFEALVTKNPEDRAGWLRIGSIAIALLPFTKNEGLVLYLPLLLLGLAVSLFWLWKKQTLSSRDLRMALLWYGIALAFILIPWLAFKWYHGMPFGNAKDISGFEISWQPDVLQAIVINTFFEGNWHLLFPAFLGLLAAKHRLAFSFPFLALTGFVVATIIGQMLLFAFTPLSIEVLMQTGYARGLIHLVPLVVVLSILLLSPRELKIEN